MAVAHRNQDRHGLSGSLVMSSDSLHLGSYVAVHALHWLMTLTTSMSISWNQIFYLSSAFVLFAPWWHLCVSCMAFSWKSAGMTILWPRSHEWCFVHGRLSWMIWDPPCWRLIRSFSEIPLIWEEWGLLVSLARHLLHSNGRPIMSRNIWSSNPDILFCNLPMYWPTFHTERMPRQIVCGVCRILLKLDH